MGRWIEVKGLGEVYVEDDGRCFGSERESVPSSWHQPNGDNRPRRVCKGHVVAVCLERGAMPNDPPVGHFSDVESDSAAIGMPGPTWARQPCDCGAKPGLEHRDDCAIWWPA